MGNIRKKERKKKERKKERKKEERKKKERRKKEERKKERKKDFYSGLNLTKFILLFYCIFDQINAALVIIRAFF